MSGRNPAFFMKIKINNFANCLCEGIKIKVKGNLRFVSNCHCIQCMKTHGNFAAYTSCEYSDLIFINNKTLKWFKSSKYAKRGFCSKCGASIFFKALGKKDIHIAAGMFNRPVKLKTIANIFTKSKLDYYKLDRNIPKFNRYS